MSLAGNAEWAGQVVVVTGVSRGIGRAVARQFAQRGAAVVGVYRSRHEEANALAAELHGSPGSLRLHAGDVADSSFVRHVIDQTIAGHGRLDVLVNNAGIAQDSPLGWMTDENWTAVFSTNLRGAVIFSREALPHMLAQKAGVVVNVVSVSGVLGRAGQANYAAAKGAIIGWTQLLAQRYGRSGIRANAIAPGLVSTEMIDQLSSNQRDEFLHHTHLGREGTPDEVAATVRWLSGRDAAYLSGQVIACDGGFLR